jgi:2-alkenal reductase
MQGKSQTSRFMASFAALVLILALGAVLVTGVVAQDIAQGTEPIAQIYDHVSPSVVAIAVEKQVDSAVMLPGFGQQQAPQIQRGLGSGFVLNADGYILTNDHVVDGVSKIEVAFNDGTLAHAHVIGTDPDSDIAVIQVENVTADKLHPIAFANSDQLHVGETVLAIGSPFGERWTLTTGIVSGIDRVIQGLTDYSIGGIIQTDAAINPGNSGGPLLNMDGEVVGVNAQIASASGSSAGVGFAIPANLAQRVANELIDQGFVEYSYLGLSGGDVSLDTIEALNLPNDTRGVFVNAVTPGGPADRAGLNSAVTEGQGQDIKLSSADIITAINGQPLYGMADLISYLARDTHPGDTAALSILRNGTDQMDLEVRLTPRPHQVVQS